MEGERATGVQPKPSSTGLVPLSYWLPHDAEGSVVVVDASGRAVRSASRSTANSGR